MRILLFLSFLALIAVMAPGCEWNRKDPDQVIREALIESARYGYKARGEGVSWFEVENEILKALP